MGKKENISLSQDGEGIVKTDNAKTKKKIIIAIVCLFVAAAVLAVLNMVDYDVLFEAIFKKDNGRSEYNYRFYDADYTVDILSDESYLSLDRTVTYVRGAVTLIDVDLDKYPGGSIIKDYLECLINGDVDGYNSLFSESYYSNKEHQPQKKFPMQRIYKIKVSQLQDPYVFTKDDFEGKLVGTTRYLFSVEYYIQYNTGLVRNDIPSDASRPIYIEIYETPAGKMSINNMSISGFTN